MEFKRGDIVYWKPDDGRFKTKSGDPMAIAGIYLETDPETGKHLIIDCIAWNGEWYSGAEEVDSISIPNDGLKSRYFGGRKREENRERLLWKYEKPDTEKEK